MTVFAWDVGSVGSIIFMAMLPTLPTSQAVHEIQGNKGAARLADDTIVFVVSSNMVPNSWYVYDRKTLRSRN